MAGPCTIPNKASSHGERKMRLTVRRIFSAGNRKSYCNYKKIVIKYQIISKEMNPENWAILMTFYIEQNRPELLEDYTCDFDEDTYFAYYPPTKQGEMNGKNLVEMIRSILQNIELLYQFVKETSDEIDWQ